VKYLIETTSVFGGEPFKMLYDDEDTKINEFLERKSVFQYVKDLVACNHLVTYPRTNINVNGETIWTMNHGFIESWLKKELAYIIRN
jgi:hypothetical protein